MDLDFSEEQNMLRELVRSLCADHAPLESVRKLEDDPQGYSKDFWKQLAELGLTGMLLPESYGGGGQTLLDAAVAYEEFGRALAPSPHFVSAVLSAGAILRAASEAQKKDWLPRVANGEAVLTPAWLEPENGFTSKGVQVRATAEGDGFRISGTKRHVAFASSAERLLVIARTGAAPDAIDLFLVDPKSSGIALTQEFTLASDTQYKVAFDDVRVAAADRIGANGSGWRAWQETLLDGIVLLAAQAMGGAERALELTVQYAKERKQFDKPLGAFQAISHYLADASTAVDGGHTLVWEAAWARSTGRPIDKLAPMAKLFACQTFRDVTAMCQQVWGGVGFTIEYDIQLYFRRAKQLQLSWYDTRTLEELVAHAVLD
jgi:alkylation response protein AidB-like acyl-CoA dehydrogenase